MGGMLQWIQLGGPAMWLLVLMSVSGLTLFILKLWDFSERRIGARDFVAPAQAAWERGQAEQALSLLSTSPSPLASVLSRAVQTLRDGALHESQARERIERDAVEALETLRAHLRTLDLIGSLAPLVGLLGTVLGMIEAFQALQAAGDRVEPAILSGGIWEALLTTAVGLGIAIAALGAVAYFERRVETLQQAMESALTRLLTTPRRVAD